MSFHPTRGSGRGSSGREFSIYPTREGEREPFRPQNAVPPPHNRSSFLSEEVFTAVSLSKKSQMNAILLPVSLSYRWPTLGEIAISGTKHGLDAPSSGGNRKFGDIGNRSELPPGKTPIATPITTGKAQPLLSVSGDALVFYQIDYLLLRVHEQLAIQIPHMGFHCLLGHA